MGWDALAKTSRKWNRNKATAILRDFRKTAQKIIKEHGYVDGGLPNMCLGCSASERILSEAINYKYSTRQGPWSVLIVKEVEASAQWEKLYTDGSIDPDDFTLIHSVKEFIRLCSKYEMPIKFSW